MSVCHSRRFTHCHIPYLQRVEIAYYMNNKKLTICHLLFYYTSYRLNMFRALLYPSSGARDYDVDYHIGRLILSPLPGTHFCQWKITTLVVSFCRLYLVLISVSDKLPHWSFLSVAFTWYSFLSVTNYHIGRFFLSPLSGTFCQRKITTLVVSFCRLYLVLISVNEKFQWHHQEWNPRPFGF